MGEGEGVLYTLGAQWCLPLTPWKDDGLWSQRSPCDILPLWVSMLAFSPLLWSVPDTATVGIHGSSPLIYGMASPGTELAATWEQWEPAAELRLGCTCPQPRALEMVHFLPVRCALAGDSLRH